jgi:hypothetical protein
MIFTIPLFVGLENQSLIKPANAAVESLPCSDASAKDSGAASSKDPTITAINTAKAGQDTITYSLSSGGINPAFIAYSILNPPTTTWQKDTTAWRTGTNTLVIT